MQKELKKLPKHIACIIDGNGRWAKSRGLTRSLGHKAGFSKLEKIIKECLSPEIKGTNKILDYEQMLEQLNKNP